MCSSQTCVSPRSPNCSVIRSKARLAVRSSDYGASRPGSFEQRVMRLTPDVLLSSNSPPGVSRGDERWIQEFRIGISIEAASHCLADIPGIDEMRFHVFRNAPMRRIARTFRESARDVIDGRHADSVENAEWANSIRLRNHPRLVDRLYVGDLVDQQTQRGDQHRDEHGIQQVAGLLLAQR